MKLQQFKTDDGIELYIDNETGASVASQSGYARMANINRKTVYNRINTEKLKRVNLSENLATQDLDPAHDTVYEIVINNTRVTLLTEEWIVDNLATDNPKLLAAMTKLGVRATLHKWAGYTIKSEKPYSQLTFEEQEDRLLEYAEKLKERRQQVKKLQSQIGNAKQKVKDNLQLFEEYFDENISLEDNIDKFSEMIIEYRQEIMHLEHQFEDYKEKNKDNVNHFFWEKRNICTMSEGERRAFGRLITKICNRYNFNFDEKTNVKNGQDLNVNHYPLSLLNRIFNLVNGGHNYAYIVEQFADLGV